MKRSDRDFVIPFSGLKVGKHIFEFEIADEFFEAFEYSLISKGKVHIVLVLDKKETMMVGEYTLNGSVYTECDRCNDPVEVEISGEYKLIYKFDTEPSDDESLVILPLESYEMDIRETILELITVSLPSRCVHEEGECNQEMIELLEEYSGSEEGLDADDDEDDDDVDPRWEELRKLK